MNNQTKKQLYKKIQEVEKMSLEIANIIYKNEGKNLKTLKAHELYSWSGWLAAQYK